MTFALNTFKSFDRSLDGVTRLCLGTSAGCFLAGGVLVLADAVVPLGPRGVALLFVGCFFLAHGLVELVKDRLPWAAARRGRFIVHPTSKQRSARDEWASSEQAAA